MGFRSNYMNVFFFYIWVDWMKGKLRFTIYDVLKKTTH